MKHKQLILIALLCFTDKAQAAGPNYEAIGTYAGVQAAALVAATTCKDIHLTPGFFPEMASLIGLSAEDEKLATSSTVGMLDKINAIVEQKGADAWCASVVPSLITPVQDGLKAPVYRSKLDWSQLDKYKGE